MICDVIPPEDSVNTSIFSSSNIGLMLAIIGVATFIGLLLFLLLRHKKGE